MRITDTLRNTLRKSIERQWYARPTWLWSLAPLSPLFQFVSQRRRTSLQSKAEPLAVPVIVVGNITVGGTGKTPVVIALCERLKRAGWRPAVISRGYGSETDAQADALKIVDTALPESVSAKRFGDEPTLIAKRSACPVIVSANRLAAASEAIARFGCDVIVSDDGLQHYRLPRQLEFAVVDAARCLGNGHLLPIGPLREKPSRLRDVDFIVLNQHSGHEADCACKQVLVSYETPLLTMHLAPLYWQNIATAKRVPFDQLDLQNAVALAGIGHPQRFEQSLNQMGFDGAFRAFPDHHDFTEADLAFAHNKRLLMTAKDAVKCEAICKSDGALLGGASLKDAWFLEVAATFAPEMLQQLDQTLEGLKRHVI